MSEPAPRPSRPKQRKDTLPAWARAAMPRNAFAVPEPIPEPEPEPEPEEVPRKVWRVGDLLGELRGHMERAYADVWVRGEISNLRAGPSGHVYFSLKEGDALLSAVMFRGEARKLRFRPEDGLEVLLRGRVSLYEPRGQLQVIAEYLEPVGAGSLQVAFEQLKRALEAEGLFALDRKRRLPPYPRSVGVVTSPSGAVIRDFLHVAGRRCAGLNVLLYPAVVQGTEAAMEIAAGIAHFCRERTVEVIVIARGGGSLEDLAAFNSEIVARAIASSALPVISAVGHETDYTIADFVADLRAPTPSAAAELVTAALHTIEAEVEAIRARLGRAMRLGLAVAQRQLTLVGAEAGFARLRGTLQRREQRVDELRFRLERAGTLAVQKAGDRARKGEMALLQQDATYRVRVMRERFDALTKRLERAGSQRMALAGEQLGQAALRFGRFDPRARFALEEARLSRVGAGLLRAQESKLEGARHTHETAIRALSTLSPLAVLSRGYALVYAPDGSLLRRADAVQGGSAIGVRLAEGSLGATVNGDT